MVESTYPAPHFLSTALVLIHTNHASPDDFFWDVSWGAIPLHRSGNIIVDPPLWKCGLPGGSSKLAALAAKRRREREEALMGDITKPDKDDDAAITMLDTLSLQGKQATASSLISGTTDKEQSLRTLRYPMRRRQPSQSSCEEAPRLAEQEYNPPPPAVVIDCPAQRALASRFASTLCGPGRTEIRILHKANTFPAPYAHERLYDSEKAFAGLSPDDVVRAAQAKSAGGGQR